MGCMHAERAPNNTEWTHVIETPGQIFTEEDPKMGIQEGGRNCTNKYLITGSNSALGSPDLTSQLSEEMFS